MTGVKQILAKLPGKVKFDPETHSVYYCLEKHLINDELEYEFMAEDSPIDVEKLVSDKIEKGVVGSTLILENRKLGDNNVTKLSNLEILSEVISLDLGENNISDTGVHTLVNSPYIENLKTLNLKSNNLTEEGAKFIAESPKLKDLEHLILKFNRIGEIGANYLAQSETLTNLRTLDLFRNRIGDAGVKAIKKSKNFRGVSRMRLD